VGDIETAVAINPVNWKYRFFLANEFRKRQKYTEALEQIRITVLLNPYHINSYNNLAVNYVALKKFDKAINVLKNALKISPKNRIMIRNLEAVSGIR